MHERVARMRRWLLLLLPALALALLLQAQSGEAKIGDVSRRNTLKATAAAAEDEFEGSADNEDDEDYFEDDDYDDEGSGRQFNRKNLA